MNTGVLALWHDRVPEKADFFETWFQHEHLPERLAVPGFRRGRRWETVKGDLGVFTCYETETPEILSSPPYLARLDDPTPWTTEVMANVFRNMSRTLCRVAASHGAMRGAWSATVRLDARPPAGADAALAGLARSPGVARAQVWERVGSAGDTEESRLRGGDGSIAACLIVETLREPEAHAALAALAGFGGTGSVHRFLCELTSDGVP